MRVVLHPHGPQGLPDFEQGPFAEFPPVLRRDASEEAPSPAMPVAPAEQEIGSTALATEISPSDPQISRGSGSVRYFSRPGRQASASLSDQAFRAGMRRFLNE